MRKQSFRHPKYIFMEAIPLCLLPNKPNSFSLIQNRFILIQVVTFMRVCCGRLSAVFSNKHRGKSSVKFSITKIWCHFDRASSLICGNKMPTRCNRGFYCRSYCLLNMFRAPLCPSSGAQKYYTVVAVCGISCCVFQVAGLMWSWGLCVRFTGCCSILQTGHITLSSTPDQQLEKHSTKYHRQQ